MTNVRVGNGFDVHALVAERPLVLGGVTIAHERGLEGHSDADVLLHAACDAILARSRWATSACTFPIPTRAGKVPTAGCCCARSRRSPSRADGASATSTSR